MMHLHMSNSTSSKVKCRPAQRELVLKDARVRPVPAPQPVADWWFNQIRVTLKKSK